MFGADTPLVWDAIQMAGLAAAATGAAVWFFLRRRSSSSITSKSAKIGTDRIEPVDDEPSNIEQRVRVLERIATDRSIDLAEEIEALRVKEKELN